MDSEILKLKQKCKKGNHHHPITIKDFKVIYYLWNDQDITKEKILEELKRHERTCRKIYEYIKEYLQEHRIEKVNDNILEKIMLEYLKDNQ
jgi:predicted secreted protein